MPFEAQGNTAMMTSNAATCTAPVNIAVIKYWGKREEKLVLPLNGSVSATLDQEQMRAKTTVAVSQDFTENRMWLNGHEEDMSNSRLQNVIKEVQRRASEEASSVDEVTQSRLSWKLHICSENNFPTAAGLASSAAGYACLVYALSKVYRLKGDISDIARRGSGSACRSVHGGFVEWISGEKNDGSDSIASQVVTEMHWPELRVLILVVSGKKKHTGSSVGMQISVRTSQLINHRAKHVVPQRICAIKQAIHNKDFKAFADITMQDSNQLHAICLDTYPPISYMTDVSRDIVHMVHKLNDHLKDTRVAYTFDAGPNACLYLLEKDLPTLMAAVQHFFPAKDGELHVTGYPIDKVDLSQDLIDHVSMQPSHGAVQYAISTKVGPGPLTLTDPTDSLLNEEGFPKHVVTAKKRKIDDAKS